MKAEWSEAGGACLTGEDACELDNSTGNEELITRLYFTGELRSGEIDSAVDNDPPDDDLVLIDAGQRVKRGGLRRCRTR